jgi:hypothetical protein
MKKVTIKLVGPDDQVRKLRPPTIEEIGLKHEMNQFYSLKATMEELFGRPMYMELKETTDLAVWRRAAKKLLDAVGISVKHSVKVADDDWYENIEKVLDHGRARIMLARTAADLFAGLTATLTTIVFTQLGFMPTRSRRDKMVPLSKEYWQMNNFRTIQYVQTPQQRKALEKYRADLAARQRPEAED